MDIIKKKHFVCDIMFRPLCLCLGVGIGSNQLDSGKLSNLFLEIDILFWTFGFEIIF